MPVEILRAQGGAPRMGDVTLQAGGIGSAFAFDFTIYFASDGTTLGRPRSVTLQMDFGDYCRNQPTWLRSVIIGPSGQMWRVNQVFVPAGPDRNQDWSGGGFGNGYGGPDTQALLDAAGEGGLFKLALEDNEGRLWKEVTVDTLDPAERGRMFARNRDAVEKADPTMPVASTPMLMVVEAPAPALPSPPRSCPSTAAP